MKPRKAALHIGPVGAEDSWRPDDLAALPRVGHAQSSSSVVALDEVLALLSEEGDRCITAFGLPGEFVEALRGAGFPVSPLVMERSGTDVLDQTLAQAEAIRPQIAGMVLRPYAVRAEYERLAAILDLDYRAPDGQCAALVNSKSWSNQVVVEQGWAGAAWHVTSLPELERRVAEARSTVLLKDPYGVSGQGTVVIRAQGSYRAVARHLARQVERGMRLDLLVQPLFDKQWDVSSHWSISSDGTVRSLGCLENDVDGFRFRGAAAPGPETRGQAEQIESAGRVVCEELFAAGYFGPVSIDGLITAERVVVPCLEVNARVSMGTVALAMMRRAARQGLSATLAFIGVRADGTARQFSSFADRLHAAGLLYDARQPGVLPLTANTWSPGERGRLILGVFHRPGDAAGMVRQALGIACASGIHPEDRSYSCRHVNAGPGAFPGAAPQKTRNAF